MSVRVVEPPLHGASEEAIETGEEGGERLAGAGRRGEEHIAAGGDQGPGLRLYRGGLAESSPEPRVDYRMEAEGMEAGAGRRAMRAACGKYRHEIKRGEGVPCRGTG